MRWAKCLLLVVSVATALPTNDRDTKAFSLFSVVSFPNEPCNTAMADMQGLCMTKEECGDRSGTASGNCASGFGVCCFTSVDGAMETITNTMTYISNPGFPTMVTEGAAAQTFTYPIQALASTATIRLDFQTGVFDQPTSGTGACGRDTVTLTRTVGNQGTLCGTLTGQHIYLENSGTANVQNQIAISIGTGNANLMRTWKILVRIIEAGDPSIEGRSGFCTQWFTGATGRITSLNHLAPSATQGRMVNFGYAICIRPIPGLGCVDYRESNPGGTPDSFRLDNQATNGEVGGCANTALMIPNTAVATPLYCGTVLSNTDGQTTSNIVRSTGHHIAVLHSTATQKAASGSFDLMYQQVQC